MKKRLAIIITLLILALAIGFGVYHYLDTKTKFNGSYVNGNTAGNLYNEGLFCEYGDYIYFANPSDGGKLYSMKQDGSELTLVSDDVATYINADANYLYYVRNNPGSDGSNSFSFLSINTDSLIRVDHDGEHELILDTAPSLYASLVGDYVYYIRYDTASDTSSLYKVKLDGSEKQLVRDDPFLPAPQTVSISTITEPALIITSGALIPTVIPRVCSTEATAGCRMSKMTPPPTSWTATNNYRPCQGRSGKRRKDDTLR